MVTIANNRALLYLLALGLSTIATQGISQSTTVYKTVDPQGHVSFSDIAPTDSSDTEIIELKLIAPSSSADAQQRLEEMRQSTDRMASARREREQARAALQQQQSHHEPSVNVYREVIYQPYIMPLPPRPQHQQPPHTRPPLMTGPQSSNQRERLRHNLRHNSQLMRPILSPNRPPRMQSGG